VGVSSDNGSLEQHLQADLERIVDLHKSGISVFRFTAIEVLENIEFVLTTIEDFLGTRHEC
jgi:very-short-patch-repair endonuclease